MKSNQKMTSDLITIGIPVYERTEFFEEALNSAINQTVGVPVIVIDNASSHDKFREIVERKQASSDCNIRYVRNDKNVGLFGNWNRCAELASTLYFMVLCSDDELNPLYIETFLETRDKNHGLSLYYTAFKRLGTDHRDIGICYGWFNGLQPLLNAALYNLTWPTNSTVYLTKDVLDTPWLNPSPKRHANSDYLLAYQLCLERQCFGNNKPLYILRSHGENAGSQSSTYTALSHSLIFYHIFLELRKRGVSREAQTVYYKSAASVVNAFINNRLAFNSLIAVGAEERDPYILFIVTFWEQNSLLIRLLIKHSASNLSRCVWVMCKMGRFLSRFEPCIFEKMMFAREDTATDLTEILQNSQLAEQNHK